MIAHAAQMPSLGQRFVEFTRLQLLSCIFPFSVLALLGLSHAIRLTWVPRYDLLFVGCILVQIAMVRSKLETIDEAKTITLFHLVGIGLEVFKVRMGSWAYPEEAWLKIGGVPLYSGFMYASVGSYVCQAWRRFELRMERWPASWQSSGIATATYANFFTHHWIADLRWLLMAAIVAVYRRTVVAYRILGVPHRMPLVMAFALIGLFVWVAENIATRLHAWQYPYQTNGWRYVDLHKISSWALLVIISVVLVAQLKRVKAKHNDPPPHAGEVARSDGGGDKKHREQ